MSSILTNGGRLRLLNGTVVLLSSTIKAVLLNNSYVPDKDHEFISDVVASEISGTGYASGFSGSGRKTLASKTLTKDNSIDRVIFDAADIAWTGLDAGTVAFIALCVEVTNDAASPVIAVIELSAPILTNGSTFTWQIPATGIFVW